MLCFASRTPGIVEFVHQRAELAQQDEPEENLEDGGDLARIYEDEMRRLREENE